MRDAVLGVSALALREAVNGSAKAARAATDRNFFNIMENLR
jgi:hypothetical protein